MTHETNDGKVVGVTLDAAEVEYVASRLELFSRMCERHKKFPGGAVEQEGREAAEFARILKTPNLYSEKPSRLTLLLRFADVCRNEVLDDMTDYEAVARQHKRLARIALNGGVP